MISDVLFEQKGFMGHITLNRPDALNALTLEMCLAMTDQLISWAKDDSVKCIAISGAGEKAFCAGGDIRTLYEEGQKDPEKAREFYYHEYRLNTLIKEYPKPYIAFLNGITMGGGVGVSIHGSYRVAIDNTLFAMPETGIGLFPDVGGTYFLPRLPDHIGMYLGLTGARLKAADCLYTGLATHYIPTEKQTTCLEALASSNNVEDTLAQYSEPLNNAPLHNIKASISKHFAHHSVEEIITSLENEGSDWAKEHISILKAKSPTSQKVTHKQLTLGKSLDFRDAMELEYLLTGHFVSGTEFFEGVRAIVIDKDQAPNWNPNTLEGVGTDYVESLFEPIDKTLDFIEM